MPQKLLDWLPLPALWDGVEPYRRMLANVLGFPATPVYGNDESHEDATTKTPEQPKLLAAPARNSPRKKRRNKKRKRDRGRNR